MRNSAIIFGVLILINISITTLTLGQTQGAFDQFLSGIPSCEMTSEFQQFRKSLDRRVKDARGKIDQNIKVLVPARLENNILLNGVKISGDGEYRRVEVPLTGSWKGLNLKNITFYYGNENGIRSVMVTFNASRSEVQQRFYNDIERGVARSKAMLAKEPDLPAFDVGITKDGGVFCDESN